MFELPKILARFTLGLKPNKKLKMAISDFLLPFFIIFTFHLTQYPMKILLPILILLSITVSAQQIPAKTNQYVNDYANVLSSAQEIALADLCKAIEKESTTQVVVVIINNVSEDIEDYSLRLAENWGIGRRKVDNGVLILVCPDIRKSRIEVGYGLEGTLTDAYTKRLQVENFRPNFKRGDFYTGIYQAVSEIKNKINPTSTQSTQSVTQTPIQQTQPVVEEVLSPEAKELRHQEQVAREKESAEATASFLNFLLWAGIIGGIGLMIYFAVAASMRKQREKEEAERKERLRIRQEEEMKQRELDRAKRNAEAEVTSLDTLYNKVSADLVAMHTAHFLTDDNIVNTINTSYQEAKNKIEFAAYDQYAGICRPVIAQIKDLTDTIISNFKIKREIEGDYQHFKNHQNDYKNKFNKMSEVKQRLAKYHGAWKNQLTYDKSFNGFTDDVSQHYQLAITALQAGNFSEASRHHRNVNTLLNEFKDFHSSIQTRETELNKVIAFLKNDANSKLQTLIDSISRLMANSYVSHNTRTNWRTFINNHNYQINQNAVNPFREQEAYQTHFNYLKNNFYDIAQNEIQAEEDRLARIRREEERERKRIHDLAIAVAAAAATAESRRRDDDYYSSSSTTSSSNDTNFGGGSFGGGGSSDSW